MVARHEQLGDEVFFVRLHAARAASAATLLAVLGDGHALDVAGVADGHDDVLVGDQVLDADVALGRHDLGATLVAVALADLVQLAC